MITLYGGMNVSLLPKEKEEGWKKRVGLREGKLGR
jgi:hypothetical protein